MKPGPKPSCRVCGHPATIYRLCTYCWSRAMRLWDETTLAHGRP